MKKVIFITEGTISPRVLAAVLSSGLERFAHIETIDEKKENLQKLAELIAASGEPVLGAKKVVESLTFELKKLELKENPALLDLTPWYRRFDKTAKKGQYYKSYKPQAFTKRTRKKWLPSF